MDRRTKASRNRDRARRLAEKWGVVARQVRYSDDGHWYATLARFPAALFDARGYVLFATEAEYLGSTDIHVGKQISVPRPGISGIPGYVLKAVEEHSASLDVDIHSEGSYEGLHRLVIHLQRERNQSIVRRKKKQAASLDCEVCGFSFERAYGGTGKDYCEVHHLVPLAAAEQVTRTRLDDLAILCANCHRVVHLRNPPYSLDEVRGLVKVGADP